MNEEIKNLLGNSIIVNNKVIPVSHIKYDGTENTYITWTLLGFRNGLSANDKCIGKVEQIDIDIFSKGNYLDIKEEIYNKLTNADWMFEDESVEMYEDDTEYYHQTITFEKERVI